MATRTLPSHPESTLALLASPYTMISSRCDSYGTDLFATRLLLQDVICMRGAEAAEVFYDQARFQRQGAAPRRVQQTLFGKGGVQGMDDAAHRHRKAMFLSLMTPIRVEQLARIYEVWWHRFAQRWSHESDVVLYDQLRELLTGVVCEWAGIPLSESELQQRTTQLSALFDYAGAWGPKHWLARIRRRQSESWAREWIERVRAGTPSIPDDAPAHVIAMHRDLQGKLLPPQIAAVELLNVLRPTVAVSVYAVFVAHALEQAPECRTQLAEGDEAFLSWFVEEVRRYYPFFPFVVAKVREEFEWQGYRFDRGRRVALDLYGTNHDARSWPEPDVFRPERFRDQLATPFNFVPQGGGEAEVTHRCPGEPVAVELMKSTARLLTTRLTYTVPPQDLKLQMSRLPAVPASRFVISNVQLATVAT